MRCEQIRDLLSPYMDDMTNEKENRLVESHLVGCQSCREELERMRVIASCLNKLEVPPCPEELAHDVRRRLLEEKSKVFSLREAHRPKRRGWIAAVVAGFALMIGMYASSVLPLGNIVVSWQDKKAEEDKKVAVIDKEPFDRIIKATGFYENDDAKFVADADKNKANNISHVEKTEPSDVGQSDSSMSSSGNKKLDVKSDDENIDVRSHDSTPKLAEQTAARIKVDDLNKSVGDVIKIAQASGAEYKISSGNMQAMSGNAVREIEITVEKNEAEVVLQQLSYIGEVKETSRSQVELTQEYNKIEAEIAAVTEELNQARDEENEAKTAELEEKLKELNAAKNELESQMNKVTLKVYLVEEVTH
ncbi:zf-HC2 domain-containing protein [Thermosyntropha sp.]|uniref:zf-HC2 domain-containing protein n=1 Tax=Thermosyntropha sp. TaxID=2740820 RepID=UPI0025F3B877|nr:zf-HC2 domain-containing protein [Thermosyntropha sp.]MBO8158887.1 zf-HC2 domain-containing protein [Thermosyntropha sp.]